MSPTALPTSFLFLPQLTPYHAFSATRIGTVRRHVILRSVKCLPLFFPLPLTTFLAPLFNIFNYSRIDFNFFFHFISRFIWLHFLSCTSLSWLILTLFFFYFVSRLFFFTRFPLLYFSSLIDFNFSFLFNLPFLFTQFPLLYFSSLIDFNFLFYLISCYFLTNFLSCTSLTSLSISVYFSSTFLFFFSLL